MTTSGESKTGNETSPPGPMANLISGAFRSNKSRDCHRFRCTQQTSQGIFCLALCLLASRTLQTDFFTYTKGRIAIGPPMLEFMLATTVRALFQQSVTELIEQVVQSGALNEYSWDKGMPAVNVQITTLGITCAPLSTERKAENQVRRRLAAAQGQFGITGPDQTGTSGLPPIPKVVLMGLLRSNLSGVKGVGRWMQTSRADRYRYVTPGNVRDVLSSNNFVDWLRADISKTQRSSMPVHPYQPVLMDIRACGQLQHVNNAHHKVCPHSLIYHKME